MIPVNNTNQKPDVNIPVFFENADRPFTELLALFSIKQTSRNKNGKLSKVEREKLRAMCGHATHAMASLIWGMESLGHTFAIAANTPEMNSQHVVSTGHFIQSLANLMDALHTIRNGVTQELKR